MSSTNPPAVAAGQQTIAAGQATATNSAQFYHTAKGQTPLPTASNYALWSRSIQFILRAESLWQIVIGTEMAPPDEDIAGSRRRSSATVGHSTRSASLAPSPINETFRCRQDSAASHIWSSLSATAQSLMKETLDPAVMWTELKKRYDNAHSSTGRINLRLKLFRERPHDGEPIADFISRLSTYQIQLQHTPQAVSDEDIILHILGVLPATYAGVARHIKERPQDMRSLDYVTDTLMDFDRTELAMVTDSQALPASTSTSTSASKRNKQDKRDKRESKFKKSS